MFLFLFVFLFFIACAMKPIIPAPIIVPKTVKAVRVVGSPNVHAIFIGLFVVIWFYWASERCERVLV